jgi:hypothetical protein
MGVIDLKQKVTSRLPLEPTKMPNKIDWKDDGLCQAVLHSVELRDQTDESGEFEGITRKVLDITFTNYRLPNSSEPERFITLSEKAIGTKMTRDGVLQLRPEIDVVTNNNDMYKRIKHILDNCATSPTYRDITTISEKDLNANFDLPGLQANGTVVGATPQEVAALRSIQYDKFLTYICNFFNGNPDVKPATKPIFKNESGNSIIQGWLKVLASYPKYNYYAIPNWVSQGFFEYASIDPKTFLLRKPLIISIRPNDKLDLVPKGGTIASANDAGMPTNILGINDSMADFLKQQAGQ